MKQANDVAPPNMKATVGLAERGSSQDADWQMASGNTGTSEIPRTIRKLGRSGAYDAFIASDFDKGADSSQVYSLAPAGYDILALDPVATAE